MDAHFRLLGIRPGCQTRPIQPRIRTDHRLKASWLSSSTSCPRSAGSCPHQTRRSSKLRASDAVDGEASLAPVLGERLPAFGPGAP
jgi:hypothetical protein